jgi:predicted nucleic acid-binding protein
MKNDRVILDTGPLVAVLSATDSLHGWAVKLFNDLPWPALTCEAVLSETFFRLRKDDKATGALCAMIDNGAFRAIPVVSMGGIARYVVQYRVDFADACLVALSENFPTATIVTTDKRDFAIMRRFGKERIPFIAP